MTPPQNSFIVVMLRYISCYILTRKVKPPIKGETEIKNTLPSMQTLVVGALRRLPKFMQC